MKWPVKGGKSLRRDCAPYEACPTKIKEARTEARIRTTRPLSWSLNTNHSSANPDDDASLQTLINVVKCPGCAGRNVAAVLRKRGRKVWQRLWWAHRDARSVRIGTRKCCAFSWLRSLPRDRRNRGWRNRGKTEVGRQSSYIPSPTPPPECIRIVSVSVCGILSSFLLINPISL